MAFSLLIEKMAWEQMRSHAEKEFPDECCGFFYGIEVADQRKVMLTRPVMNTKDGDKRRRFEISPLDYMHAEKHALDNNLSLLGVYHSHPQHPAIPSEHDLKQAMPWFSYIIISIQDRVFDHVRSWRLNENTHKFEEENFNQ